MWFVTRSTSCGAMLPFLMILLGQAVNAADLFYETSDAWLDGEVSYFDGEKDTYGEYSIHEEDENVVGGVGEWNIQGSASAGPVAMSSSIYLRRSPAMGPIAAWGSAGASTTLVQSPLSEWYEQLFTDGGSGTVITNIFNPGDPVQLTIATAYAASDPWQTTHQAAYARLGDTIFTGLATFYLWPGETVSIVVKGQVYVSYTNQPPNYDEREAYFGSGSAMARWAVGPSLPPAEWAHGSLEPPMPPDRIAGINSGYLALPVVEQYGYMDFAYAKPSDTAAPDGETVTGYRFGASTNFAEILITEPLPGGQSEFDIEFGPQGEHRHRIAVGEPFSFTDVVAEGVDYFHLTGFSAGGPTDVEADFPSVIGMRFTNEAPVKIGHGAMVEKTFSPLGFDISQAGGVEFTFSAANPGAQVLIYRQGDAEFSAANLALAEASLHLPTVDGLPLCYDIVGEDLGFAGGVDVTFHYDDAVLASLGIEESELKMWHIDANGLVDITTNLDTAANLITGNTSGLSGFAVGTPVPEPSTFVLATLGVLGLLGWGWRRKR